MMSSFNEVGSDILDLCPSQARKTRADPCSQLGHHVGEEPRTAVLTWACEYGWLKKITFLFS